MKLPCLDRLIKALQHYEEKRGKLCLICQVACLLYLNIFSRGQNQIEFYVNLPNLKSDMRTMSPHWNQSVYDRWYLAATSTTKTVQQIKSAESK